jgi:hypothetical protein
MPFSREDAYKCLTWLNQSLIRHYPYELQSVPEYSGYDAVLSPQEYRQNQAIPKLFEIELITDRLNKIAAESEYLVQNVQGILTELQLNADRFGAELNSTNFAMSRADVVYWDQAQKTAGLSARRDELIENLRQALSFPPSPKGGGNVAALHRS